MFVNNLIAFAFFSQCEHESQELVAEVNELTSRVEEADGNFTLQNESLKRRDAEIARMRQEMEQIRKLSDENIEALRRRHQNQISEFTAERDALIRAKHNIGSPLLQIVDNEFSVKKFPKGYNRRAEKDRSEMASQLEKSFSEVEQSEKARVCWTRYC
ncbi:unnamed protein product [Protopolystoma xenopodis]|uniref:Myosin tail domain-containing protein n=1 Tax=Protopolystoma xenopodis TaxID=117903 RepID=A0A448XF56_9PLAT|nr:unnamed protein product [Protopolystoma xenopodis]